jgi:hypothetical protein
MTGGGIWRAKTLLGELPFEAQCLIRFRRPLSGSAMQLTRNTLRHLPQISSCNGIELIIWRIATRSGLGQSRHTGQSSSPIELEAFEGTLSLPPGSPLVAQLIFGTQFASDLPDHTRRFERVTGSRDEDRVPPKFGRIEDGDGGATNTNPRPNQLRQFPLGFLLHCFCAHGNCESTTNSLHGAYNRSFCAALHLLSTAPSLQ